MGTGSFLCRRPQLGRFQYVSVSSRFSTPQRAARDFFNSLLGLFAALAAAAVHGESATVAVAANFIAPIEALADDFSAASGHELVIVGGSSGQLYAQIVNGAPFDVFLSADQLRPQQLIDAGLADGGTRFTYAHGLLVLWSRRSELLLDGLEVLGTSRYRWLAIANPALAPYGAAARQALERLELWPALRTRIVRGQNIGQTFAMVETGNAELGLIALSQALTYDGAADYVEIPPSLYDPIRQDAIALPRAEANTAARSFLGYLRSDAARAIITSFGYSVAD
jgi:molybdate transport system substrate-binding protein